MRLSKYLSICVTIFLAASLFSAEARAERKIGILMFSEETRYSEASKGMMDQLKEEGLREPKIKVMMENAGGNKAKAAELARKFAEAKLDLIIAIGTSAAIAAAKEIKDAPIVFSMVYDPVEAKIADAWKSSGNNITGASPRISMLKLVTSLKELTGIQRLAVLYTPAQKNSEIQLKELQGTQDEARIKVVPVPLTKEEDIANILPEVARTSDAIFLSGSSIVGANVQTIVAIANTANVVTITHLDDLVEQGALLGVCANPYLVGRLAGKKAVQVLHGAKPSSIPIETLKKFDLILNLKTAKAGKFKIPPNFMKKVTKTIE